jgi:hypothetical protein
MARPGGAKTQQGARRTTSRAQYLEHQRQRQLELQRQLQRRNITRFAMTVGGGLLVTLLALLVIHAATGGAGASTRRTAHRQYTSPALGETREGLACLSGSTDTGTSQHIHSYLAYYVNGNQVNIPANTGALTTCDYPVHEHAETPNILHVEAPNQDTYYLGDFFAIWGQHLSASQVGDNVADATHPLVFETIDASGRVTKWPSDQDPWYIPLVSHETIYILYNSRTITPSPYTSWNGL